MRGKLKTLGIGMLATIAVSAVGVIDASAEYSGHFVIDVSHATVIGSETATHKSRFSIAGGTPVECEKVSYEGSIGSETVAGFTVAPKYEGCKTKETGTEVKITVNECRYTFKSTEKVHATFLFLCENGPMELHHPNCTVTVPQQQQPASGVSYTTVLENGKHALTATLTLANIEVHAHGLCSILGTNPKATLTGSITLRATDTAGNPVNLTNT